MSEGLASSLGQEAEPATAGLGASTRMRRHFGVVLAVSWLALLGLAAIAAPLLPIAVPSELGMHFALPPGVNWAEPLGTDQLSRSMLSRVVYGARVSLAVAIGATGIAMVMGTLLGVSVGYFRGFADHVFEVGTNTLLAFPPLMFLIGLSIILEPSLWTLIIGLGVVATPTFARVARANTIAFATRDYVTAAKILGAGHGRIIFRELLPNVILPVASYSVVVAAVLIVAEGSLSFLGLGVPPPAPSWGGMIAAGRDDISTLPHLVFVPGAFFFLTVFALSTVGDRIRETIGRESALR